LQEAGSKAFDEAFRNTPTDFNKTLLSSMHLLAPCCSSYAHHEWDSNLAKIERNESAFCIEPIHACDGWIVQNQVDLESWNGNGFAPQTTYFLNDQATVSTSSGHPLRIAEDYIQAFDLQNEDWSQQWLAEQGNQGEDVPLTTESAGGQPLLTPFRSSSDVSSYLPSASALPRICQSMLPIENEPHRKAPKNQESSLGLMTLFGMKRFARLGAGSTRDSAMTAEVAGRIKQALEVSVILVL
jgi:hypothetical protein